MSIRLFNLIAWLIIISIVSVYVLLAFNTFLKFDDYCFRITMAKQNPFSVIWDHYLTHDGRALSPLYLSRNLLLQYLSPEHNALLASMALIGIAYFISAGVQENLGIYNNSPVNKLLSTILLSVCLWLGIRANLSRVIYWPIGTFYIYASLFLMVSCYYLYRNINKIQFLVFGVLTIMSGINVGFSFLIIYLVYEFIINKSKVKDHLVVLVFFIFFFLIMFLAPGNFTRASKINSGYDLHFVGIIRNYFTVLIEYVLMSKWIPVMGFLSSFLFRLNLGEMKIGKYKLIQLSVLMVVGALLTIMPFVILPQAATRHTSLFFQILLFLSVLYFSLYLSMRPFFQRKLNTAVCISLITILFLYEGITQYKLSAKLKEDVSARITQLKDAGTDRTVIVDEIKSAPALYTHFYKDYPGETWAYDCMSAYYQCGKIIMSIK